VRNWIQLEYQDDSFERDVCKVLLELVIVGGILVVERGDKAACDCKGWGWGLEAQ